MYIQFQRKYDVNHIGIKIICNNKLFPSLNIVNVKSSPYLSKGIIIHYHYLSDPKLCLGIVAIKIIPCSCHACKIILSDSKIIEAFNQHRCGRVYNFKYSQILGCHNNWNIMGF